MAESVSVVIEGCCLEGFAELEVRARLARLTRQTDAVAAALLAGRATKVKSGVDAATGERYLQLLQTIGVACRTEPEPVLVDLRSRRSVRVGSELPSDGSTTPLITGTTNQDPTGKRQRTCEDPCDLAVTNLSHFSELIKRFMSGQAEARKIWDGPEGQNWFHKCRIYADFLGSADRRETIAPEKAGLVRLTAPVLRKLVGVMRELHQELSRDNEAYRSTEMSHLRSRLDDSLPKYTEALQVIEAALGQAGAVYGRAVAEVARQESIWFGKDFKHARKLLWEAELLGHPDAPTKLHQLQGS